ncbi:hypothetical protein HMPREF1022_01962 [Desulfovibrio sp. 6_1_46AFAA]|nr:hypothetical protein HMPREF1022_01962 [Desulfovibrio sp. 6_1_46AFAA]
MSRALPLLGLLPIVRPFSARRVRAHLNRKQPMLEEKYTGNGKVLLLAGGGKIYTDLAARFVRSERELEDIAASPYSRQIVRNILSSGHRAALEFDYFLFGVEGYSRVTEAQLVRKRLASYLIKSGRAELNGKRRFSVVYPREVAEFSAPVTLPGGGTATLSGRDLAELTRQWYEAGLEAGLPEENLRYLKPQATEFKAIIGMNAHALLDWFAIRCCRNAQHEIRDLAWKMLRLCRGAAPDLFEGAGPNCVQLGYCPENNLQNARCKGRIITKDEALAVLRERGAKGKPARWGEAAWSNAAWSGSTLEAAPPSDSEFEEE